MTVEGNIGSVRWTVESADSTLFYGLAMDGTSGIVLDNFSLRGSSGLSLRSVPVWMMREFNEQRPYDLIILQYGLNVATERGRNYDKVHCRHADNGAASQGGLSASSHPS